MITISFVLHAMAATLWIGGMFFAHMALRPAALQLNPPQRLQLWVNVFGNFFPWVWLFAGVLVITGYADLYLRFGGIASAAIYLDLMHAIGLVMTALFSWLYFKPYRAMVAAIEQEDFPAAASELARIRVIMVINLSLGLFMIIIGVGGAFF